MKVLHSISEVIFFVKSAKQVGKSVGFVPTMGALHAGHLSLIAASQKENNVTIVSIYINPTQFNNKEDFEKYPKLNEADISLLDSVNCDAVFIPSDEVMYPDNSQPIHISFGEIENILEGKYRKGHFQGVGLVVSKLFNIVQPDRAYFGQKDLQQFFIISKLVADLSYPIELVCCPTIREADGLAMSSRNMRLTAEERKKAGVIYVALSMAELILKTTKDKNKAIATAQEIITKESTLRLEYLEVVDYKNFSIIEENNITTTQKVAICLAAYLGNVRLIDNIVVSFVSC